MASAAPDPPIRDAATVILLRRGPDGPSVLMGRRGAKAAFMPSKYVFPGGGVEPGDRTVALAAPLDPASRAALGVRSALRPEALAAAAIRELAEETGQRLAAPGDGCDWPGFAGLRPDPTALRFAFRAVTPPGRPRRFDARFFMADAEALATDPDRFDPSEAELSDIAWVPLRDAGDLDMPFVTEVALAEVAARIGGAGDRPVAHLDNTTADPVVRWIGP